MNALTPPEWSEGAIPYPDEFLSGARRYDMGERANFILVPIAIAAMRELLDWSPAAIAGYLQPLVNSCAELGEAIGGERIPPPEVRSRHMIGFKPPTRTDLRSLAEALRQARIHVSLRGGNLWISPHVYNNREDIDRLFDVLRREMA